MDRKFICCRCYKSKKFNDFTKDKRNTNGISSCCKECHRVASRQYRQGNREKINETNKLFMRKKRENKKYTLEKRCKQYGILTEKYFELLEECNNKCMICAIPFSNKICIDHNHKSNSVRGLLCHKCNVGLGLFKDSPYILYKAMKYLKSDDG